MKQINGPLWLNYKITENKLGNSALRNITLKYSLEHTKSRQVDFNKYQCCKIFLYKKLGLIVIMDCKTTKLVQI